MEMDWAKLQADFEEEINDAEKYGKLSKKSQGHDRQMFMDMAWEEYCHAKHVCWIMKEHGIDTADHGEELKRVKKMLREIHG